MKKTVFLFSSILFLLSSCFTKAQDIKKTTPKEDYVITITTDLGEMKVLLYDTTSKHKANFIKLTNEGYFNGTTFHRIIKDFMIQGGDPNSKDTIPYNDGQGGPDYTIPAEFVSTLKHVKGALSAARMGDQVNPLKASSGSQFYIVQNEKGTPFLDGSYTVFGQVIKGMEVIDKIATQPKGPSDRPTTDIKMNVTAEKMKVKKIIQLFGCTEFYQ